MKKFFAVLLAVVMMAALVSGCAGNAPEQAAADPEPAAPQKTAVPTEPVAVSEETKVVPVEEEATEAAPAFDYSAIPDEMTSEDGKYRIALISDIGTTGDNTFNKGIWEGVKRYAAENGISYRCYTPANLEDSGDSLDAMEAAAQNGAELMVCAGQLQVHILPAFAIEHPDIHFIFVDGMVLGNPKTGEILTNVAPITFDNAKAGYLAGYAAVMEGYTDFGFAGGGGKKNGVVEAYCYGYVRGISDAAAALGVDAKLKITWKYGETYQPSPELEALFTKWYENGTQVIFSCGGGMCNSAFAAAAKTGGRVIGVDVDQSAQDPSVLTSAIKALRESVYTTCAQHFNGGWAQIGGELNVFGINEDAVGIPTDTWSMEHFTVADYEKVVEQLKNGTIVVDSAGCGIIDYAKEPFANLAIEVVK